jgi:hypothetical protein
LHKGKAISAHDENCVKTAATLSRERVRALAVEAGFVDAGVTALPYANEERDAARFEQWIAEGRAGSMRYLERRNEAGKDAAGELVRARVRTPFPWARSAIVCWAEGRGRSTGLLRPAAGLQDTRRQAGWVMMERGCQAIITACF